MDIYTEMLTDLIEQYEKRAKRSQDFAADVLDPLTKGLYLGRTYTYYDVIKNLRLIVSISNEAVVQEARRQEAFLDAVNRALEAAVERW